MPAMIFQEPMTNLNPCYTVGFQILEALKVHEGGAHKQLTRGCAFHMRRIHVTVECAQQRPDLRKFDDRRVACHHANTVAENGH